MIPREQVPVLELGKRQFLPIKREYPKASSFSSPSGCQKYGPPPLVFGWNPVLPYRQGEGGGGRYVIFDLENFLF